MRSYELVLIVHPEVDDDGLAAIVKTVRDLVERGGGKVVEVKPWGLRRLAYPIRKVWEGQYVLMHLELDPLSVAEFERGLGLTEQILRHLVVRLETDAAVTTMVGESAEEASVEDVEPSEELSESAE